MADLQELAFNRAALPLFPGATAVEQLRNAWQDASARMNKYVGNFLYDPASSEAVLHEVGAWLDINAADLKPVLEDPNSSSVPEKMALILPAEKMQQFIVARYSEAVRGLVPWFAGIVDLEVAAGLRTKEQAGLDAADRLAIFGSLKNMDEDGTLKLIFSTGSNLSGLGSPAIVAIVAGAIVLAIIGVSIVSSIVYFKISSARLDAANKWADEICKKAQDQGDKATIEKCLEIVKELQKPIPAPPNPVADALNNVLIVAAVVGVAYVVVTFGLPALERSRWGRAHA